MAPGERGRNQALCYGKCRSKLLLTKRTIDLFFLILGHSKVIEIHGVTSDFYPSASKSDRYLLFNIAIYLYNCIYTDRPVSTLIPLQ